MEYYSAIRKDKIMPFVTWMDLEDVMLSEISQTGKVKNHIWFHSYVGYKTESNKWTHKKNKQTKTERHRQQYGGYKSEGGGRVVKDIPGGKRFDFGWWAHNEIYRWCMAELYAWNL